MPERHPGWVSGINDFEARLASGVLIAAHVNRDPLDALRVRSGIRDAAGDPGKATLTGNTVRVNPFQAVIQDVARPALGPFMATLDSAKDLTLFPAEPSSNRTDLVIAEVDPAIDPGFIVQIVKGVATSATTPQLPDVANPLHLMLAQIFLAPNKTPVVQDKRQFTAALGGILPVQGTDDLPSAGADGSFLYRKDTGVLHVRRNSDWTPYRQPRQDSTWIPAKFTTGTKWASYGSPYAPVEYTRTEDGWVRLRGLVKWDGANPTAADLAKPVFTLPAGYQPKYRHLFWVPTAGGKGDPPARLQVWPNGDVAGADATYVQFSAGWTSLDGISFATY